MKAHPYSIILQVPTTQLAKMSIDLKFVELTADVLEIYFIKHVPYTCIYMCVFFYKTRWPLPLREKTHSYNILRVPTTQLAKMSMDPKFVKLTADVLELFL